MVAVFKDPKLARGIGAEVAQSGILRACDQLAMGLSRDTTPTRSPPST